MNNHTNQWDKVLQQYPEMRLWHRDESARLNLCFTSSWDLLCKVQPNDLDKKCNHTVSWIITYCFTRSILVKQILRKSEEGHFEMYLKWLWILQGLVISPLISHDGVISLSSARGTPVTHVRKWIPGSSLTWGSNGSQEWYWTYHPLVHWLERKILAQIPYLPGEFMV